MSRTLLPDYRPAPIAPEGDLDLKAIRASLWGNYSPGYSRDYRDGLTEALANVRTWRRDLSLEDLKVCLIESFEELYPNYDITGDMDCAEYYGGAIDVTYKALKWLMPSIESPAAYGERLLAEERATRGTTEEVLDLLNTNPWDEKEN